MRRRWIRILAALGMALCLPLIGYAAEPLDLGRPCELTVYGADSGNGTEDQGFAADLEAAGVVIDLYKVADAVKAEGTDSYRYRLLDPYEGLEVAEEMDNGDWRNLAQEAARIALAGKGGPDEGAGQEAALSPVVTGAPAGESIVREDSGAELYGGLYLIVARGEGIRDYVVPVTDEEGTEGIGTVAWSEEHVYTFSPELVSLPGLDLGEGEGGQEGTYGWIYDPEVYLKPQRTVRYGSVEIVKVLSSYETAVSESPDGTTEEIRESAVFVFQVEAELNGRIVYSDVASLSFREPGRKSLLLEKLPVGSVVRVTEVYGGAGYRLDSDAPEPVTVKAGETVSVEFVNVYDGRHIGGHGITNRFRYDGGGEKWDLTQIR